MKIQLKVEQPRIAVNLKNKAEITFTVNKYLIKELSCLKTEFLELTIKEWHEHRTTNQNSYYWVLINQLAEKFEDKPENIYRSYIRDYGVKDYILLKDEAVDKFINLWSKNGIGWFAERLRAGKTKGTTTVVLFYGSSSYTTQEMATLTKPVIEDCEKFGIPTICLNDFKQLKNENDVAPNK